ncbi:type III pantothenate kinase [Gallaecimonas kandeliae]|uniref:type III pantothenate kinase n=1 Tax=Gallaecimonas kandeliae TaxID=3029055 RepID=UPI002648970C|nr:type III pantothenate kinase [Gallaecimonas kandeliae]WKE65958.1 type III pantothenate kinase [Gallaecimonas kandeliae]
MTALLVEVGNSYLKAALEEGRQLLPLGRFGYGELAKLEASLPPDSERLCYACVGQETVAGELEAFARALGLDARRVVAEASAFGVTNAYPEAGRLGVDRWLAMLAAFNEGHKASLVLDIGTAATADLVDDQGRHRGGWIAPGFAMMTEAVLSHTAKVLDYEASQGELAFGINTGLGLNGGCQAMVAGFVHEAIKVAEDSLRQSVRVLMTGGGLRHLPPSSLSLGERRPDLVLEGLALYSHSR